MTRRVGQGDGKVVEGGHWESRGSTRKRKEGKEAGVGAQQRAQDS